MNDFPWGTIVIFTVFCLLAILAFAEGLSRQKAMQNDIKEIRDAVHVVARKAGGRIARIEGQLEHFAVCPIKDRRSSERRKMSDDLSDDVTDDWTADSNFKPSEPIKRHDSDNI